MNAKGTKGRWRAVQGHELLVRTWDGDRVVYHCGSGDTHLLNAFAFQALQLLGMASADQDELAQRMAAHFRIDRDQTLHTKMGALITDLDRLGLIEPADP